LPVGRIYEFAITVLRETPSMLSMFKPLRLPPDWAAPMRVPG